VTQRRRAERCPRCELPPVLCLCPHLQALASPLGVITISHAKETGRSSNSARLLPLLLEGAVVLPRGGPDAPCVMPPFDGPAAVLFPSRDAAPLTPEMRLRTLLVPDGNWRQARRIALRTPEMARLPRLRLPIGAAPLARLRGHPDTARLATIEAVARALGVLGHSALQNHLETAWTRFAETIWRLREGGI